MILDDILARSGLQEGIHYENQITVRNDDQKMLRPDVVVHYPDGKDVIIDSKVSLTAYVDYMNAETPEKRQEALDRHLKSVNSHT